MQTVSLKKITLLGFSAPAAIALGAFVSVAIGRGEAIMLPSTVAALALYGVLIAAGAAWRDGAPQLFAWTRRILPSILILGACALALSGLTWLAAAHGVSWLVWRPALTAAVCVWLGVGLASVVPPRVTA